MRAARFDYELPAELIAQQPADPRDTSRLLVDRGPSRAPEHRLTRDLPELIEPGDLLVLNETRVLPARLALSKPTGGAAEVLVLEPEGSDGWWRALVRPSRRIAPGSVLVALPGGPPVVEVGERIGEGERLVRFCEGAPVAEVLDRLGAVPLPPYITEPLADSERYQTVYARRAASVAAPTAGLHLTEEVLGRCAERGAAMERIELIVGLDTFRPITAESIDDHPMHTERYELGPDTLERCRDARRVVAVGTTVVRALESAALTGDVSGRTDLFIRPGHEFALVDALLTNFHLPRSSLLVLVEAFIGPRWRELYELAADEGYRFLSFGDAMFLERGGA